MLHEVEKEGPNKGKFFWKCAVYPFCKFFLWQQQATLREKGLHASASEAEDQPESPPRPKTPTFTQQPLASYGILITPSRRSTVANESRHAAEVAESAGSARGDGQTMRRQPSNANGAASPATPGSKRKRDIRARWDEDEFSDLDSDEERQLVIISDRSAQKMTPQGAVTGDIFLTPVTDSRTTDIVGGLPTPSVSRTLFPASSAARGPKTVSFEDLPTPGKTPSSDLEVMLKSPAATPSGGSDDVTDKVMSLLQGQKIDPSVLQSVRGLLQDASRKTKGIAMGRDMVRVALKEREQRICKLQDRLRDLENKAAYHHKNTTEVKRRMMVLRESCSHKNVAETKQKIEDIYGDL